MGIIQLPKTEIEKCTEKRRASQSVAAAPEPVVKGR